MEKRVTRIKENLSYVFDAYRKPVLTVKEGERFIVETEDNLSGMLKSEKDLPLDENFMPYAAYNPPKHNPITGPIYIEGADKGDLLQVNIEKIIPANKGLSCIFPNIGPFADSRSWPDIAGVAFTKEIKHVPGPSGTTEDGRAIYNEKISWELSPLIGTIGVAPEFEVQSSSLSQEPAFGNWDCRDIKAGNILYLNIYNKGGLLYLGDVHASQGDAELSGMADEVKSEVTLSCSVIKNKKIPYARIEKKDSIISLYAAKPLEDAVMQAIINLMEWMVNEYDIKPRDAYILITIIPEFKINIYQMVKWMRLQYTVGAEFPKKYLVKK